MSKPEPVTFPSDDFTIVVGGRTYHPHTGESVTLFPTETVGEVAGAQALARIGVEMIAAEGDPDEQIRIAALSDRHFEAVCAGLAGRVVSWTWTNNRGEPLPQPDGTPETLARLTGPELNYLLGLKESALETAAERGKDSKPSRTTSSASARRRSRM